MRILSWNVNGLRAVLKKGFLDWLRAEQPDVLCVQETKATPDQLADDVRDLPGYRVYFSSAQQKGYSGVALYSRRQPLGVQTSLGRPEFDGEGRVLAADYGDFVLFNVYFPNGKASQQRLQFKMDFYAAFLQHLDALRHNGRSLVVCGDFNTAHHEIDLARPKENERVSGFLPEERAWMDELVSHGFLDTFRMFNKEAGHYSWWDLKTRARERNVGWRIDYCFVSEDLLPRVSSAFILPDVMGSDHCPLGIELAL